MTLFCTESADDSHDATPHTPITFPIFLIMRRAFRPQSRFPEGHPDAPPPEEPSGWPKHQLVEVSGLSDKTFDTIRKAARVSGPSHGGRNHHFSNEDVFALIAKAESGRFTERGPTAAAGWRQMLQDAGVQLPMAIARPRRSR